MNAARPTFLASAAIAILSPDIAHAAAPHSGIVVHTGFALSDAALFAFAAVSVWLARRSMRARARARRPD